MATFEVRVNITPSDEVSNFSHQEVVDAINEGLKTATIMLQDVVLESPEEERNLALWQATTVEVI